MCLQTCIYNFNQGLSFRALRSQVSRSEFSRHPSEISHNVHFASSLALLLSALLLLLALPLPPPPRPLQLPLKTKKFTFFLFLMLCSVMIDPQICGRLVQFTILYNRTLQNLSSPLILTGVFLQAENYHSSRGYGKYCH